MVHRWTRGVDLVALLWILRQMLERTRQRSKTSSSKASRADARGRRPRARQLLDPRARARPAQAPTRRVARSRAGVCYFFPRPSAGSACKRLNLFLRWMVRSDEIDLGVWTRVPAAKLIVPLDTHVIRLGHCLRLTTYASAGMEDGGRHHRDAARARSRGSGPVRLLDLPRRHDERLRLRQATGRFAMSAQGTVPAARSPLGVILTALVVGARRRLRRFCHRQARRRVAPHRA